MIGKSLYSHYKQAYDPKNIVAGELIGIPTGAALGALIQHIRRKSVLNGILAGAITGSLAGHLGGIAADNWPASKA